MSTLIYASETSSGQEFSCPKCNGHHLEEVLANAIITTRIATVEVLSKAVEYAQDTQVVLTGDVCSYQCSLCGHQIATRENDLLHYLQEQYQEEAAQESIELIASGYEWSCPDCGAFNQEIEVVDSVICKECGEVFGTQDYHHAHQ